MKTCFNNKSIRYFPGVYSAAEAIQLTRALFADRKPRPPTEAEEFLTRHGIPYVRKLGGLLYVPGDINLSGKELHALPDLGNLVVAGSFNCADNYLTSLRGCPRVVGKDFRCDQNFLRNLQHGPALVGGSYNCAHNFLTGLRGAPGRIDGNFDCRFNRLSTLGDAPRSVGGYFSCADNSLVSLSGGPQTVGKDFDCSGNRLESLRGGPRAVRGVYDCHRNHLASLFGAPSRLPAMNATKNPLWTFEGAPKEFEWLEADLGYFRGFDEIPASLRRSGDTDERLRKLRTMCAEAAGKNVAIRRSITPMKPFAFRKKAAGKTP